MIYKSTDKGFAPRFTGHEPIMLLLHQSAIKIRVVLFIKIDKTYFYYLLNIAPEGFEPSHVMMKTLCLNHLTIRPYNIHISPVQVLHLLLLITKQLHYFYANQAS